MVIYKREVEFLVSHRMPVLVLQGTEGSGEKATGRKTIGKWREELVG